MITPFGEVGYGPYGREPPASFSISQASKSALGSPDCLMMDMSVPILISG
jgi:hypothetical protein